MRNPTSSLTIAAKDLMTKRSYCATDTLAIPRLKPLTLTLSKPDSEEIWSHWDSHAEWICRPLVISVRIRISSRVNPRLR